MFVHQTSIYIAYDDTNTMMSNSLGQGHICWSFAPSVNFFCYSDKASEGNTRVQLNTHLVV